MPSEIPDRWVRLRIRGTTKGKRPAFYVSYFDDARVRRIVSSEAGPDADVSLRDTWVHALGKSVPLHHPSDLVPLIRSRAGTIPARLTKDYGWVPIPIPLFIEPDESLGTLDWETILWDFLDPVPRQRVFLVRMGHAGRRRPAFDLPLRLVFHGSSTWTRKASDRIRRSSWSRGAAVRKEGLELTQVTPDRPASDVARACQDGVLVTSHLSKVRRVLEEPGVRRPRLVILANPAPAPRDANWTPPAGVAFVAGGDPRFLKDLILGIIHDLALHEAVAHACEGLGHRERPVTYPTLTATPRSNQALRMSDALARIVEESLELQSSVPPAVSRSRAPKMEAAAQALDEVVRNSEHLRSDFRRESWGLVPLAEARTSIRKARRAWKLARGRPKGRRLGMVESTPPEPERRVDATLFREEYSPLLAPLASERADVWVGADTALRRDTIYRLRVHVGQPLSSSIVSGEVESLDTLLTKPDEPEVGHKLEIVVFGVDFRVRSTRIRRALLPPYGPSQPVYFRIQAPRTSGTANLRIAIYHRNHMVQSFLLTAHVAREEHRREGDPLLKVRQELSRTRRFTNLDQLGARCLSVGLNANGDGHTLLIKGDKIASDIPVTASVLEETEQEFRDLLTAAYDSDFDVYPEERSTDEQCKGHIRSWAQFGRARWDHIQSKSPNKSRLEQALFDIQDKSDEVIQVVRYADDHTYPWEILYDFDIPEDEHAPVCLGWSKGKAGELAPCDHQNPSDRYCARGFWGFRHHIELLLASQEGDPTKRVTGPKGSLVGIATGLKDRFIGAVKTDLEAKKVTVRRLDESVDYRDVLFDATQRPGVMLFQGHLDENGVIALESAPGQLVARDVLRRFSKARRQWAQPRSVVLLMACGSLSFRTEDLTSFVRNFHKAGALAVAGTNSNLSSALAARFGENLTSALLVDRTKLGVAVTEFRRRLLSEGNPLGFIFTVYGDADIQFA